MSREIGGWIRSSLKTASVFRGMGVPPMLLPQRYGRDALDARATKDSSRSLRGFVPSRLISFRDRRIGIVGWHSTPKALEQIISSWRRDQ